MKIHKITKKIATILIGAFILFSAVAAYADDFIFHLPWHVDTPDELIKWSSRNLEYAFEGTNRWQSASETLASRSGDCEDFAVLVSSFLSYLGIQNEIAIVKYKDLSTRHAICIWKRQDGQYSFTSNTELYKTKHNSIREMLTYYYSDWESVEFANSKGRTSKKISRFGKKV